MNFIKEENCNKSHCKTCIFHPDPSKRVRLSEARVAEINGYLRDLSATHICHCTGKTCYGGLEVQARAMFEKKLIPEPTVSSFLSTAKLYL